MDWYYWLFLAVTAVSVGVLIYLVATGRINKDNALYILSQVASAVTNIEKEFNLPKSGEAKKAIVLADMARFFSPDAIERYISPAIDLIVTIKNAVGWGK